MLMATNFLARQHKMQARGHVPFHKGMALGRLKTTRTLHNISRDDGHEGGMIIFRGVILKVELEPDGRDLTVENILKWG